MSQQSWQTRLENTLRCTTLIRPNSKLWSGEEGVRRYLGISLDSAREFETRLSMTLWDRDLRLATARETPSPKLLELRSGVTLSVSGPGLVEDGKLDFKLLRLLRNASWGGPHVLAHPEFNGLGLSVPGAHYALVIKTTTLAKARAAYREGKPLAFVDSGSPRILDRMLAWELWEEEHGAGAVPFTLSADRVEATRWRFRTSEFEEFKIYLVSTDLPELSKFLVSIKVWGLPTDLPAPVPAPAPAKQEAPTHAGLSGSLPTPGLPTRGLPTWNGGRLEGGGFITRKANGQLVVGGGSERNYDPARHGKIEVHPTHPDYGRTERGDPLYRQGGMLMTLSTFGTRHEYEPERHGAIVREPPLPSHLGIATKGAVRTYLVRRQGKVHALWKDIASDYQPLKHGEIVKQPPFPSELGATTRGYLLAAHEGRPYVLRAQIPPTPWVETLHGAVATPPPAK